MVGSALWSPVYKLHVVALILPHNMIQYIARGRVTHVVAMYIVNGKWRALRVRVSVALYC